MAPQNPPRGEKTMSSRLLTMKFMQRAAASSASKPSPSTSTAAAPSPSSSNTPTLPSLKRKRLSSSTDTPELAQISAAVKAEEDRRLAALDKQAAEAGDTRWVLDLHSTGKEQSVPNEHWSSGFILPPSTLEEQQLHFGNAGDDEDEDDEEAGGAVPGRRTFGVSKKKHQRFQKDSAGQSADVDGDEEVQALIDSERNRQQHGGKGFKNKKKRDSSGSMKYDFGDEDEEEDDEEESDTKDDDYGDRSLRDLTSISGGKIASISARGGGGGKRYSDASSGATKKKKKGKGKGKGNGNGNGNGKGKK